MMFGLGAKLARTNAPSWDSVDRGWRVEPLPSRVGTRACVPDSEEGDDR
jgi:hypothetical protein